jgi:site-specific DNA-methyltransferase (cytosine-N4-specific)
MNPYYSDSFITLYNTSSRRIPLPDESVHCVVTSPPYWNLRKYEGDRGDVWGGCPVCMNGILSGSDRRIRTDHLAVGT